MRRTTIFFKIVKTINQTKLRKTATTFWFQLNLNYVYKLKLVLIISTESQNG